MECVPVSGILETWEFFRELELDNKEQLYRRFNERSDLGEDQGNDCEKGEKAARTTARQRPAEAAG